MRLTTDLFAYCKRAHPEVEHDLDLRLPLPREGLLGGPGGRVHAVQRDRLRAGGDRRGPRGRRRSRRGWRSSSTATTTSSRRSRSSAPRGACGRASCATASARRTRKALMLRFHTQTGGVTLTAQQPENNIVRVALQGFAAVCGGTQSLHTNGFDEALALPTERAAKIALRTQQIIAHESGAADTVDPFAGSYFVEALTDEIESRALRADREGRRARRLGQRDRVHHERDRRVAPGATRSATASGRTSSSASTSTSRTSSRSRTSCASTPSPSASRSSGWRRSRPTATRSSSTTRLEELRDAARGDDNLVAVHPPGAQGPLLDGRGLRRDAGRLRQVRADVLSAPRSACQRPHEIAGRRDVGRSGRRSGPRRAGRRRSARQAYRDRAGSATGAGLDARCVRSARAWRPAGIRPRTHGWPRRFSARTPVAPRGSLPSPARRGGVRDDAMRRRRPAEPEQLRQHRVVCADQALAGRPRSLRIPRRARSAYRRRPPRRRRRAPRSRRRARRCRPPRAPGTRARALHACARAGRARLGAANVAARLDALRDHRVGAGRVRGQRLLDGPALVDPDAARPAPRAAPERDDDVGRLRRGEVRGARERQRGRSRPPARRCGRARRRSRATATRAADADRAETTRLADGRRERAARDPATHAGLDDREVRRRGAQAAMAREEPIRSRLGTSGVPRGCHNAASPGRRPAGCAEAQADE